MKSAALWPGPACLPAPIDPALIDPALIDPALIDPAWSGPASSCAWRTWRTS